MNELFNITGKRVIWKRITKSKTYYLTTISSQMGNKSVKTTIEVKFPADTFLDDGQTIFIKNGFLSTYENTKFCLFNNKTGKKQIYCPIYIVVLDYDVIGEPIIPNFATRKI